MRRVAADSRWCAYKGCIIARCRRCVTFIASRVGDHMCCRFTLGGRAIVTGRTHTYRRCVCVNDTGEGRSRGGNLADRRGVATAAIACRSGWNVVCRLTRSGNAVVTSSTHAWRVRVSKSCTQERCVAFVADIASQRGKQVRCRFAQCNDIVVAG